ncbi:SET and MYND domain-containing protein DDB_G0273589-like [Contarinia nasturtii]|uniref:SET and MYND domain-containing protein DDB_G0273589-like n=1 Tax=Contarinia nasturtii TaxID=265458 RepID=UPI0012D3A0FE|nr:SET and MYND domain-containing protein DDB_G0273589-like [Contarinia nasturtii]
MLWKKDCKQVQDRGNAMYTDLLNSQGLERIYERHKVSCIQMKCGYGPYEKNSKEALRFRQKGNAVFGEKKWMHAIECYNKSICFAKDGSELMGLAYANRSSCFFNLKMYRNCLIDLGHAKENHYPAEKMAKLDERKAVCLRMMEEEIDRSEAYHAKLCYEPNENFPCFANVLKVANNTKHGRHVIAMTNIEVGKTVMVDKPYFAETINQKFQRCNICLKTETNLKPCKTCVYTMFCSQCEENDLHKIECAVNQIHYSTLGFISFRMVVIRSILIALNTFSGIDELIAGVEEMLLSDVTEVPESLSEPQTKYRAFFKLCPNPKQQTDGALQRKVYLIYKLLMESAEFAKKFNSDEHKRFLMHLIGHHIIIIKDFIRNDRYKTGTQGVFGEDIEVYYEHCMSIPASYFNHSCAPNAYITSQNGSTVCVSVRPIRKGEELCVAYDEHVLLEEKAERQQMIQEKFKFQCKCKRCESPLLELLSRKPSLRILSDCNYQSFIADLNAMDDVKSISRDQQESLKLNIFSLLKKYKNHNWLYEISRIIYSLYTVALIESESLERGMPYVGRVLNFDLE